MWRDRWLGLGIVGAVVLFHLAVLALGAIGLGVWTDHLDAVLLSLVVFLVALAGYRYWTLWRRT